MIKKDVLIYRNEAMDALITEIKKNGCCNLPLAQRWIPCCKTVDIPDHEIMACDKYGSLMFGYLGYVGEQLVCESESEIIYNPIAWSEKPKPYREEGDK